MSFRIHAAGNPRFHYTRDNCVDGDIFEAAAIMSALRSAGPSPIGVASGVADYVVPSDASAMREGLGAIAHMTFLHTLRTAVDLLATCNDARDGWISVYANQSHLLWVDTARIAVYDFTPGDNPSSEFMVKIMPVLTATGMNNFGVLMQMSMALSRYYDRIGTSGRPMIQIQLFR
jgi:hypothetical protein